jgi:hypothetical protein
MTDTVDSTEQKHTPRVDAVISEIMSEGRLSDHWYRAFKYSVLARKLERENDELVKLLAESREDTAARIKTYVTQYAKAKAAERDSASLKELLCEIIMAVDSTEATHEDAYALLRNHSLWRKVREIVSAEISKLPEDRNEPCPVCSGECSAANPPVMDCPKGIK